MRIRKSRAVKPRTSPVKHGEGNHGKRKLTQAVMKLGFGQRTSAKVVNAVIEAWKRAILAKDQRIEMPIGWLKVIKTPRHLYRRRICTRMLFGKDLKSLKTWTIYNDPYRIIWRMPQAEWERLLAQHNPPDLAKRPSALAGFMVDSQQVSPKKMPADPDYAITLLAQATFSRITVKERRALEEVAGGKTQLLESLQRLKAANCRYAADNFGLFKAAVFYDCRDAQRRALSAKSPNTSSARS